jgi:hypothetical protein
MFRETRGRELPNFDVFLLRVYRMLQDILILRRQDEERRRQDEQERMEREDKKGGDLALEGLKRHLEMVQNIPTKDAPYGKDIYGNPKNSMGWTLATHYNYLNK